MIVTRGMRLAAFLAEVGRYRHGYLGLLGRHRRFAAIGCFSPRGHRTLLAILPQTLPVRLRYRTRWWVSLDRSGLISLHAVIFGGFFP